MIAINIEDGIKNIVYDEKLMDLHLENEDTLIIDTKIKTDVIDSNFNELDSRLSDVESQIKLRFLGEIQRLRGEIEKLRSQIKEGKNNE